MCTPAWTRRWQTPTPVPPFTRATRRLCVPSLRAAGRVRSVSQHPGRGYAGELARQQSCAQTSAPPQWATSKRCTPRELKKNQLNTAMGSIRVPLTKLLLQETHGRSSGGEPEHSSWSQGDPQASPSTKLSKRGKHSAALF